ncbi:MAG: RNA polymerase subunit sigma [Clostridium sp.]|uniref:RNA polymerase subunit sigma n=1 Tax=Clostridium sp. TaxID=1506 RepID=UPI00302E73EC
MKLSLNSVDNNFTKENMLEDINGFIEIHMNFIIKSISSVTGRYVSVDNDDSFSIGLLAFKEAVDKYDTSKGEFTSFARLVISSRVKTFLSNENKYSKNHSLDALIEAGVDISDEYISPVEDKEILIFEINKFKEEISGFGFTLEDLVEEAPKHEDTRKNAIDISEKISREKLLVEFIFEKKRLPIKQITLKFKVTEKVIKRSKKFIISVVIIIHKRFRNLKLWIKI